MRGPGVLVAAALVVAALPGCENSGPTEGPLGEPRRSPPSGEAVVIGLVGTMSGPQSWRGQDAYEGADLGVHVLNRARPDGALPFALEQADDEGDPRRALRLVRRLAGRESTVGIVYAGPPQALPGAERALAAAGIPAILCYGDLYGARRLSAHVFQASPSLLWEARRIARYLVDDRGYDTVGALVGDTMDGHTAARALREALRGQGGGAYHSATYDDPGALSGELTRLRSRGVEAVVVEGPPVALLETERELAAMDATYRTTRQARRGDGRGRGRWRPQLVGFDLGLSGGASALRPGTVASDTYARGAHYLPIPSLARFRRSFRDWWEERPLGWELRAYDAVRMIGWAHARAQEGVDLAVALEGLRGKRFGGLDVTFGPDDHTAVGTTTVGLWVVPRPRLSVPEGRLSTFQSMPWVPLARGFSIDGRRTDIQAEDWRYLFRNPPPPRAPAPRFAKQRYGVRTPASDPVH